MSKKKVVFSIFILVAYTTVCHTTTAKLKDELAVYPHQLVCEGYKDNNWDIFIMDADGSNLKNLTDTPNTHELYPQVSPDGKQVAFVSDTGTGRTTVRSVWVMDIDGKNRKKISDYARQPFWSPDSKVLAYLPQEYKKFNVIDFSTKGMMFHNLETGKTKPHPNAAKLHHLYNPGFSPDGKWITATVHAGMGFKHADLIIEVDGDKIVDTKVHGCRPSFSPDGMFLAWGATDHLIEIAPIDWSGGEPSLKKPSFKIIDKKNKIYHSEWAPNGKWLTISRGPMGKGDVSKPGTQMAAREIVGVYATGWNIFTVKIDESGSVDMNILQPDHWVQITTKGCSYKEPDWISSEK